MSPALPAGAGLPARGLRRHRRAGIENARVEGYGKALQFLDRYPKAAPEGTK